LNRTRVACIHFLEDGDSLLLAIFQDFEIVSRQFSHMIAGFVRNHDRHLDQNRLGPEYQLFLLVRAVIPAHIGFRKVRRRAQIRRLSRHRVNFLRPYTGREKNNPA